MNRILVMPDGNWLSHTSRPLEIAKELKKMGHEIIFASDGDYMKLPKDKGFQVLPIITIQPDRVLRCSRSGRANWYDYYLIKQYVKEEPKLFDEIKPDLVLSDFRLPLSISCELSGIPLAVILNAAWTNYYQARVKAPEHLGITRLLGKRLTTWLFPWIKDFIITFDNRPFNQFRRKNGLQPRKNIWATWEGDLNLIVDIPEYGPTENLPENFHYIGPIVWEPEMDTPEWLETLDPKSPIVYFSMGSTGYERFFHQAMEAYQNSTYQCIMTTAGMAEFSDIPDNFHIADYAPGSKIMEKCDVVVCHGGNGTIYQAMSGGIPIIGIPTMHDQEFNLDRVEELGIGIQLSELNFKTSHMVKAVETILHPKSYHANSQRYKQILAQYDGPKKGAKIINSFIRSKKGKA